MLGGFGMKSFEKLGKFYLGNELDTRSKAAMEEMLLYDSKHLNTHFMIIGMTRGN